MPLSFHENGGSLSLVPKKRAIYARSNRADADFLSYNCQTNNFRGLTVLSVYNRVV